MCTGTVKADDTFEGAPKGFAISQEERKARDAYGECHQICVWKFVNGEVSWGYQREDDRDHRAAPFDYRRRKADCELAEYPVKITPSNAVGACDVAACISIDPKLCATPMVLEYGFPMEPSRGICANSTAMVKSVAYCTTRTQNIPESKYLLLAVDKSGS
ncbi:hypothetical protein BV22DRAFT_1048057 [Leucogyrophana mollusca]|uniref:Uncharacterized protein n=1 Tax=Leucogyrophana mollusca TaxID=85980 RepID=A0ACB8BDZ4_9AGAM|nr:hypothetical protein BV22DRAFT_1048057 [Leucogyrophana mollusca]